MFMLEADSRENVVLLCYEILKVGPQWRFAVRRSRKIGGLMPLSSMTTLASTLDITELEFTRSVQRLISHQRS